MELKLKEIEELMSAMVREKITKLHIKEEKFELSLERGAEYSHNILPEVKYVPCAEPHARPKAEVGGAQSQKETEGEGVEDLNYITAPVVGTFYESPSPKDAPFVKVGDKVDENTVVCIIEAMKVLNEVKAGQKGTIAEMLIESGIPVEFGTKIFSIK